MRPKLGAEFLVQYTFDCGTNTWRSVGVLRAGGNSIPVSGAPSLIQSTYGPSSFELLVPNNRGVVHYTNSKRTSQWTIVGSLYPPTTGAQTWSRAATMFQGSYGSPGNLEALVFRERAINHSTYLDAWFFTPQDRQWRRIGPVTVNGVAMTSITGF